MDESKRQTKSRDGAHGWSSRYGTVCNTWCAASTYKPDANADKYSAEPQVRQQPAHQDMAAHQPGAAGHVPGSQPAQQPAQQLPGHLLEMQRLQLQLIQSEACRKVAEADAARMVAEAQRDAAVSIAKSAEKTAETEREGRILFKTANTDLQEMTRGLVREDSSSAWLDIVHAWHAGDPLLVRGVRSRLRSRGEFPSETLISLRSRTYLILQVQMVNRLSAPSNGAGSSCRIVRRVQVETSRMLMRLSLAG